MRNCLALAAFLLLPSANVLAQAAADDRRSSAQPVDAVDSDEAYRRLFRETQASGLPALKLHPNTSVAIRAAWLLTRGADGQDNRPSDELAARQFIGFLEGRARIEIPEWWRDFFVQGNSAKRPDFYHISGLPSLMGPKATTLKLDAESVVLQIADERTTLSMDLFKHDPGRMSGVFSKDSCFLALHDVVGSPHTLICIARDTGKVRWQKRVCGCWDGGTSGVHESWVTVKIQGDQVIVFGAAWTGTYIHSFNMADGQEEFRFSTWLVF